MIVLFSILIHVYIHIVRMYIYLFPLQKYLYVYYSTNTQVVPGFKCRIKGIQAEIINSYIVFYHKVVRKMQRAPWEEDSKTLRSKYIKDNNTRNNFQRNAATWEFASMNSTELAEQDRAIAAAQKYTLENPWEKASQDDELIASMYT